MSKCQQWISAWMSILLAILVLVSGMERVEAQPAGGHTTLSEPQTPTSAVKQTDAKRQPETNRSQKQFELATLTMYRKGADSSDIQQENRKILLQKQQVRQAVIERSRQQEALLASRGMSLVEYAQFQRYQLGQRVAISAMNFIGRPYVWGGTTPSGFDCSGFTQYVLSTYGIKIPRNSYDQFAIGQPVSKDELRPGDLVFFSTYAPGPSHLGIYVGDGKFVHALNHNTGVITSKLDSDYYKEHFVGARRVL